jgi:hypothetical protein
MLISHESGLLGREKDKHALLLPPMAGSAR